jgi:hypothetical protein
VGSGLSGFQPQAFPLLILPIGDLQESFFCSLRQAARQGFPVLTPQRLRRFVKEKWNALGSISSTCNIYSNESMIEAETRDDRNELLLD